MKISNIDIGYLLCLCINNIFFRNIIDTYKVDDYINYTRRHARVKKEDANKIVSTVEQIVLVLIIIWIWITELHLN